MFDSRARAKSFSAITGAGKKNIDIASQISKASQSNPEMLDSLINKINDIGFFQTCYKNHNFKALKVILKEFLKPARTYQQSAKLQQQQIAKSDQTNIKLALEIKELQAERNKLLSKNQNLKSQLLIKREQKFEESNMLFISSKGLVSKFEEDEIQYSVLFGQPRLQEEIKERKAASQPKPLNMISEQPRKNFLNIPNKKDIPPPTTNKFNLGNAPDLFSIKTELISKISNQQLNKMLNNHQEVPQYNIGDDLYKKQAYRQRKKNDSLRLNPRLYK